MRRGSPVPDPGGTPHLPAGSRPLRTLLALVVPAFVVLAASVTSASTPPLGAQAVHAPGALPAASRALPTSQSPPTSTGRPAGTDLPGEACTLCHGELELLRQNVATLAEARAIHVPAGVLRGTAHDTMSCGSCHAGFDRFPHRTEGPLTESCRGCHEEAVEPWSAGVHALEGEEVPCAACHGVHRVAPAEALAEGGPMLRMNATCVGCHDTAALPISDPHLDTVPCAGCHSAHRTERVDGPESSVAPLSQHETCGACHQEVADSARTDAHGHALGEGGLFSLAQHRHAGEKAPPTCTSCHGAHGMLAPSHDRFDQEMVDRCAVCHADAAETYFGTYHGKATAVGSEIVATCDHCHGSHRVFPSENPLSAVSDARVVETCAACHEQARPAFVAYDSHPDPMDRERNAPLFYSFVFMNTLLFGVLGVFALHTALWWVRLTIDRRKGVVHGPGADHPEPSGHGSAPAGGSSVAEPEDGGSPGPAGREGGP